MKIYTLESTPDVPVRHNPELKKKVLVPEGVSCLRHISHIILRPGDTAFIHSHPEHSEVFYCIRGEAVFGVNNKPVVLKAGSCLIVEPDEVHSIEEVVEETEVLYTLAYMGK